MLFRLNVIGFSYVMYIEKTREIGYIMHVRDLLCYFIPELLFLRLILMIKDKPYENVIENRNIPMKYTMKLTLSSIAMQCQ